ncbi:putative bifunctional diguanylate cyclase/phosphodiesterase [Sporosarcina beigongshangi]|uniref:putative bifunctional diguanylate cyclase/phosphodiesterase n=1 Tax=Sporosarcina beigongshangi TaxID=2782538 RepID=UPI001939BC17|nr:EAL domain-containing protein [Sporosarcina beigongshangi]
MEVKTIAEFIAETNEFCRQAGMNPEELPSVAIPFSDTNNSAKLGLYEEIISVTRLFSGKITELLEGIPLLIAVSDEHGVILDMVGDDTIQQYVDKFGVKQGVQFSVNTMGTNIINLSLAHHWEPVELIGAEHYYHYLQSTACYGVAFKNTDTEEILGSLVILTDLSHQNPMITMLLATMVDSIERELVLRKQNRQLNMLHQVMMDNSQYGVITTDLEGNVLEFNIRAEILLGNKIRDVIGNHARHLTGIGQYMEAVLSEKKRFDDVYITIGNEGDPAQRYCLFDAFPIYDDSYQTIGVFAQLRDITEVYNVQQRFNFLANHDEQTGLPNRRFLLANLTNMIEERDKNKANGQLAVIHLDLDRFKIVNDTLGQKDGDFILKRIANRLANYSGENNFIARVGGDDFVLIFRLQEQDDVQQIGQQLLTLFNNPFAMKGYDFHITASIGVAVYPNNGRTTEELLVKADTAMFQAKKQGKNQFVLYSDELDPKTHDKILLEASLRKAIDSDELVLYYQPQIDIKTNTMIGVEALIRWEHPTLGTLLPSEFVPLAEETGLINQMDEWVLRTACKQNKKWQDMGIRPFSVAINLSSNQFASNKLPELVQRVLCDTGLKPEYIELEITETMTMDVEHAIPTLRELNELGVKISIDDFGTGYSSMNYLTKFPIDRLKIDRSFIWNIDNNDSDSNIVITIIRMAHNLGLKVIAEGVENDKQLQFLYEHDCDEVQGFFFSKPLSVEMIESSFVEIQGALRGNK